MRECGNGREKGEGRGDGGWGVGGICGGEVGEVGREEGRGKEGRGGCVRGWTVGEGDRGEGGGGKCEDEV